MEQKLIGRRKNCLSGHTRMGTHLDGILKTGAGNLFLNILLANVRRGFKKPRMCCFTCLKGTEKSNNLLKISLFWISFSLHIFH